ncbi:hypothetical protein [Chitiniphilus eburneus]|uniref:hypothetical protein n=1 Tax=Chitiniphilus eburneus TaxID=2571148 RepID=UPI0035D009B1
MEVQFTPRCSFTHGNIGGRRDVPMPLEQAVAEDLKRAGLGSYDGAAAPQNKMAPDHSGKASVAGSPMSPSASPAAPASPQTTAGPSSAGARQTRRRKST